MSKGKHNKEGGDEPPSLCHFFSKFSYFALARFLPVKIRKRAASAMSMAPIMV